MGSDHDRLFAAQLFAPRIPPGRTLGRYPRLYGLLMTTGYSDVKVPKNNPFTCRSRKKQNTRILIEVFSTFLSSSPTDHSQPAVKFQAVLRLQPVFSDERTNHESAPVVWCSIRILQYVAEFPLLHHQALGLISDHQPPTTTVPRIRQRLRDGASPFVCCCTPADPVLLVPPRPLVPPPTPRHAHPQSDT